MRYNFSNINNSRNLKTGYMETRYSMIISMWLFQIMAKMKSQTTENKSLDRGLQNKLILSGKSKHILTTKNNYSS